MTVQTEELINRFDDTKVKCDECHKWITIEDYIDLFEDGTFCICPDCLRDDEDK